MSGRPSGSDAPGGAGGAGAQAVGVDAGGTKVAAMRVTVEGEVLAEVVVDTPALDAV
ncbi:MAG: ROK family protein, partial [Actinobacteria bacterium]|nr:ROK family protein [Actinomycetota bacterium]